MIRSAHVTELETKPTLHGQRGAWDLFVGLDAYEALTEPALVDFRT